MSSRELTNLAPPTGWKHSGAAEDDDQLFFASDQPRRRSKRMSMTAYAPSSEPTPSIEPSPPSSQSSALDGTAITPPSLPSTRTSFSTFDDSESELSAVPGDLSDWATDYTPSPKRRKIEQTPPQRAYLASQEPESWHVVLKVGGEKLRQLERNAQDGEEPEHSQKSQSPADTDESTSTQWIPTPPPNIKRKRGRPTKSDAHVDTVKEPRSDHALDDDRPPPIPDSIAEELQPLVEISQRLMNLSSCPIEHKPLPVGKPEVWADGRQALCESLPYYRAYQSAGYCTGGFALSFMFDQEGSPRDYMDSEVVISRAGGGLAKDKSTGKMARQANQTESSQVKSVRRSMDQFNPVAMLCGNRNLQCPTKMPHVYNVLDWFKPTHIWAEKVKGKVNFRYRFEKLQKEKQSWWAAPEGLEPTTIGSPPESRNCRQCLQSSQQVYLQGWMCLEPNCPLFWKFDSGEEPQEAALLYDPRFLKQHTPWPHASSPQPLRPDLLSLGPTPMLGEDVSWAAAKGLVCSQCGRCNSREAWEGWECGNPECDFTYSLPHASIPATALHDAYSPLSSGYAFSKDWFSSAIIPLRVDFAHNYRINYFTIPGTDGFIAHLIANKTINEEPGGPEDMWTELQTADLGLRRRPLQCSTLQGPMLTQHFAVNYGMPYKFIAATASRPFTTATPAITATRSRLNWAARHCVGAAQHDQTEFNELLALGYFERQKIDYHDDGERGLGPTIATLSLGAPAVMKVRLKAKHHNGVSKSGVYVDDAAPPVPGCVKHAERRAAHAQLDALDGEERKERLRALPRELGLQARGNAKDVLSMQLGHGDVVVMHGRKIQEYYEHAVDPSGKLRFALTCRYIDPESLRAGDRPAYVVEGDGGGYDGARLPGVEV